MKRLLAAGYDKIYQFSHCFRKDERGKYHNPEFTLLEWYRKGAHYGQMMTDTEQLVTTIAAGLGIGNTLSYRDNTIDLSYRGREPRSPKLFKNWQVGSPVVAPDVRRFDEDTVLKVIPNLDRHWSNISGRLSGANGIPGEV